jgi:hypothetical protein
MDKEYIEREAAVAFLENMAASTYLIQCFEDKEKFPAADVAPVRHGHWINIPPYKSVGGEYYKAQECSECKAYYISNPNTPYSNHRYCADCGAKMDEEAIDSD